MQILSPWQLELSRYIAEVSKARNLHRAMAEIDGPEERGYRRVAKASETMCEIIRQCTQRNRWTRNTAATTEQHHRCIWFSCILYNYSIMSKPLKRLQACNYGFLGGSAVQIWNLLSEVLPFVFMTSVFLILCESVSKISRRWYISNPIRVGAGAQRWDL